MATRIDDLEEFVKKQAEELVARLGSQKQVLKARGDYMEKVHAHRALLFYLSQSQARILAQNVISPGGINFFIKATGARSPAASERSVKHLLHHARSLSIARS
jgi:hypothetical protein